MKIKKIIACLVAIVAFVVFTSKIYAVRWTFGDAERLTKEDQFFFEGVPQRDLVSKSRTLSNFLTLLEECSSIEYEVLIEYLKAISMDSYNYEFGRCFDYEDWRAAQRKYLPGVSFDFDQYERDYPFNCDDWLAVQMEICVIVDYSKNYDEILHNLRQLICVYSSNEMIEYHRKYLFVE